jgi:hypothetical protein
VAGRLVSRQGRCAHARKTDSGLSVRTVRKALDPRGARVDNEGLSGRSLIEWAREAS